MKLLFFFLLGLCAVGAVRHSHRRTRPTYADSDADRQQPFDGSAFEPGHEFHYHFDVQYDSGMSGSVDQHSFTRLFAKVYAVFETRDRLQFKLSNVKVGKANKEITGVDILPMSAFDEIRLSSEQIELMELPFTAGWDTGIFRDMTFDERDTTWSKNLKRGMISSGQIDMRLLDRMGDYYSDKSTEEEKATYEDSVEGRCKVFYTRKVQNEGSDTFNVTKTIDYKSCTNTKNLRYNYRFASACGTSTCNENPEDLDNGEEPKETKAETIDSTARSTVINMMVSGNSERYLLHQVDIVFDVRHSLLVTRQETDLTTYVRSR